MNAVELQAELIKMQEQLVPQTFNMIDYICPVNGTNYRLNSGEQCQCHPYGNGYSVQQKNALWEMIWADDKFIYRGYDVSNYPQGTVYGLFGQDDSYGSKWAAAKMAVNDVFPRTARVKVFDAPTGAKKSSDDVVSYLKVVNHYPQWTSPSGRVVADVVELQYSFSADFSKVAEHYFYANGFGLVGFDNGTIHTFITNDPAQPLPALQSLAWAVIPPLTPTIVWIDTQLSPALSVNLRQSPSTSAPIMTVIHGGVGLKVYFPIPAISVNGYQWAEVQVNGLTGYVALVTTDWTKEFVLPDANKHLLDVPFASQFGWNQQTGLCGETSAFMLLELDRLRKKTTLPKEITPATIAVFLGITGLHDGSTLEQMVAVGLAYGVMLQHTYSLNIDVIKGQINTGDPIVVLLNYSKLPTRKDTGFVGDHILVVVGYSDQFIYANDSDNGKAIAYPVADFVAAFNSSASGNRTNQAVYYLGA